MGAGASTIPEDGALRVSELFLKIDIDCDGKLSKYELRRLCDMKPDAAAVPFLNELVAEDENGFVTTEEWNEAFQREKEKGDESVIALFDSCDELATSLWDERIENSFHSIDLDDNGGISKAELTRMCVAVGYSNSKAVIDELFHMYDANDDGQITLTEWKSMFSKELSKGIYNATGTLAWFEELISLWRWTKTTPLKSAYLALLATNAV